MVALEHAAETLRALDVGNGMRRDRVLLHEQLVAHALVISLVVVVFDVFVDGMPQMTLTDRDDPVEALFFD